MSEGLYSGVSGLALGTGLYKDTSGLWSGASGLIDGFGFGNPTLNLNFLPMSTLPSTVTFSRTTQATLTDSTGRLTYAPNNLLTNSESFEAAAWSKTTLGAAVAPVVTANAAAAPDGTLTADRVQFNCVDAANVANRSILTPTSLSAPAGIRYNASVWVRAFDLANVGRTVRFTVDGVANAVFTLTADWQRITLNGTAAFTVSNFVVETRGTFTTQTADVLIWGAQLEAVTYQTTPGTYNSTTPKNLLGFTQEFDNAAWTKSNSFVQTNLLTFSDQFDNAAWSKNGAAITANATVAPDGTNTADKVVETATTAVHNAGQSVTTTATAHTFSCYVKGAERNFALLYHTQTNASVSVNLSTGATGTASGTVAPTSASVTSVGNGWYRVTMTVSATAASNFFGVYIATSLSGSASYTGDGTSGIFVWGAQLVQGATAGDYQPTAAAAAPVQYVAPDGTLSADKLVETATNTTHRTFGTVTTAAISYTYSVYLKAAERTWAYLRIDRNGGTNPQAWFNLSTGAVGTVQTGLTASIQSAGNGWYRCAVTIDAAAAGTANPLVGVATANAVDTYAGDGTSGIFVWGAQLSNSASLDPYVYNPAAAPTSAAFFGPRFDFDPVTLAPRGLLIEEQRTNRTRNSEDFTAATWVATVVGTSTRVNDGAPLGFTRGLITATSATGGIRQIHTGLTSGQVYALSFYIQSTATSVQIVFENGTSQFGSPHNVTINPSNGTAGVLTGFTSVSIQPFGPGYVYTLITAAAGGALAANIEWRITNSGNSIWLGRPQFEAGAFATSYIPTVASQVTRTADVASMLGANFSNWFNAANGSFLFEGNSAYGAGGMIGSTPTTGAIMYGNGNSIRTFNGTNFVGTANTFANNAVFKAAVAYSASGRAVVLNGGTVATDANLIQTPTAVNLGSAFGGGFLNGHIRSVRYFPTRLSNTQLQALTA